MRIKQVHVSHHITFFAYGFMKLWGLVPYHDKDAPALFFGCYDHQEVDVIKAHRGFRLVMPSGEGSVLPFTKEDNIHHMQYADIAIPGKPDYINTKILAIPVQDFRYLKPVPLGDKIYCYQGRGTEGCKNKYNFGLLKELMDELGEDRFIIGYRGHTMPEVIEKLYTPSFINLQLNTQSGFSSTLEMAHMGRMSVCNVDAPFCVKHKGTAEDIISFIEFWEAAKNSNFCTELIAESAHDFLHYSDDWLHTEYWQ